MKNLHQQTKKGVFSILAFVASFILPYSVIGCDYLPYEPSVVITVVNGTNQTLQIFFHDHFVREVIPAGNIQFEANYNWDIYVVTAKNSEGIVIYTTNFTHAVFQRGNPPFKYSIFIPATTNVSARGDNLTSK